MDGQSWGRALGRASLHTCMLLLLLPLVRFRHLPLARHGRHSSQYTHLGIPAWSMHDRIFGSILHVSAHDGMAHAMLLCA